MTDAKKKRLSMLDSLAAAGATKPSPSMMTTNRPLRAARDAVDAHQVWDIDPDQIIDTRINDRIDPADVMDLRDAIEANGQTVPILVRRHPSEADRYLLVYGRRRVEAIRLSDRVAKVRALIASMDDTAAVKAQISENMARRDLSFIEKALFAQELVDSGFGNQSQVAEILTVTKSSISMALAIVEMLGPELIRAIGAAHGVGRPRWDALAKAIEDKHLDRVVLAQVAHDVHTAAQVALVSQDTALDPAAISQQAFEAVVSAVGQAAHPRPQTPRTAKERPSVQRTKLEIGGTPAGTLKVSDKGLSMTIESGPFADWLAANGQSLIQELHTRWIGRDEEEQ